MKYDITETINKISKHKLKECYNILDEINKLGTCMYAVAPSLKNKTSDLTLIECNDIVLSWINERGYNVRTKEEKAKGPKKT